MNINLPNDKLGFYTVKDKKFYSKVEAIVYANDTLADIQWNFNKDIFNKINWRVEPDTSLLEFYKLRAQQIREEYDYVIVMASGGADSTNVIYSFLKNGIHIDEVVLAAPLSGLSNWNWNDRDTNAFNTISETKFAQLPLANEIRLNWPNVKVTVNDYFEEMLEYKSDEWMYKSGYYLHPTSCRYSLDKLHHIKNIAESGKRIAKVFGLDKPTIVKGKDGMLFNVINDGVCQVGNYVSTKESHTNLETVYFYFTPDLPQMMVKQSHVLAKWMYKEENKIARDTIASTESPIEWNLNENRFSIHHRANIPVIYPMLEGRNVFQAFKSFQNFTQINFDNWFYKLHGDSMLRQMIDSDFANLKKNIDKRYFNEIGTAFVRHSQPYLIGFEDEFNLKQLS